MSKERNPDIRAEGKVDEEFGDPKSVIFLEPNPFGRGISEKGGMFQRLVINGDRREGLRFQLPFCGR